MGRAASETVSQLESRVEDEKEKIAQMVKQMKTKARMGLGEVQNVASLIEGTTNSIAQIMTMTKKRLQSLEDAKNQADEATQLVTKRANEVTTLAARTVDARQQAASANEAVSHMGKLS